MADLQRIQFKRTNTSGSAPAAGVLAEGELALNLKDRCVYSKDSGGNIVNLSNPLKHDGDQDRWGQIRLLTAYGSDSNKAQIFHDVQGVAGTPANIRSMRENGGASWLWEQVSDGKLIYSSGVKPTGKKLQFDVANGQILAYGENGFRAIKNNIGAIIRNDGVNCHFLVSTERNGEGAFNSLRPLSFNLTNGTVTVGQGLTVNGGGQLNGNYRVRGGQMIIDAGFMGLTVESFDGQPSEEAKNMNFFGAFRTNGNYGMDALTLNVPHVGTRGHGRGFTMEYGSNSPRGRIYTYGYTAEGNLNYKHRMWHDGDKPTPTEMGVETRFWGTSDYADGTLIETDLDASQEQGASFTVDILGKTYVESGSGVPLHIVAEGYLWNRTFYSANAKVDGPFEGARELFFLKLPNGKLGIWFSRQGYWRNYGVTVYQTNAPAGYQYNHVTNIVNSAKPASDKILSVPLHYTYGTYRKPTADDIVANSTINGSLTLNGTQYIDCRKQRNHLAFRWSESGTAWIYVDPNQNLLQMSSPINFEGTATWKPADGSNSHVKIRNWGNAAAGRATVMEAGDEHGWYWYAQRPANNAGSSPEFHVNGSLYSARLQSGQSINTSSRAFRTVGRFGSFWHNDSMDRLYLMFTGENDAYSENWSDKRPVIFNMRTGSALFSHGVSSSAGFHLPAEVSITWNSSGEWAGGIGWGLQEERATGDMILHRYNNGVWQNAPFRFKNDSTFECGGNGNFNDVYIRSDRRLKINLERFDNASNKLRQLTVYTYDKLAELGSDRVVGREIGIIAQDLRKIVKEAVNVSDDENQLHTISNSAVNAVLIKAVQEILDRLDAIEARI